MKCPNCGLENIDGAIKCDCGWDFRGTKIISQTVVKKYRALYTYANMLNALGWAGIVVGVTVIMLGIAIFFKGQDMNFGISTLFSAIGVILGSLAIIAFSQLIRVLADTEENTRRIATLLEK